jgi:hypothetical protein
MLQVLFDQTQEVSIDRGGPLGHNGPCVHVGSEAGVVAPTCMCRRMCTAIAGGAGPADAAAAARGDRQELLACRVGPAQAKCEAEAWCTRPYHLAHAFREVRLYVSLPLAVYIQGSASPASFAATCRGSTSRAWTGQ